MKSICPECVGCGSVLKNVYATYRYQTKGFKGLFPDLLVYRCSKCCLRQVNHALISENDLTHYYNEYYSSQLKHGSSSKREINLRDNVKIARGKYFAAYASRFQEKMAVKRIFELGPDLGHNLLALGSEFPNAQIFADELNPTSVIPKSIQQGNLSDGYYDIVLLSAVLEHLLYPGEWLDKIYDALIPGGIAILEVPNESDFILKLNDKFEPHVSFFDPKSLEVLIMGRAEKRFEILEMSVAGQEFNRTRVKVGHIVRTYLKPFYRIIRYLVGDYSGTGGPIYPKTHMELSDIEFEGLVDIELQRISNDTPSGDKSLLRAILRKQFA